MDFQRIMGFYEKLVIDTMAPVPVFVAGQQVANMDAKQSFALVRVSMGRITESSIGDEAGMVLRGVLVCELYTPKAQGPGVGRQKVVPTISALLALNATVPTEESAIICRAGKLVGPEQMMTAESPHLATTFSCTVWGRMCVEI